jgi:hypothetical protein
VVERTNEWYRRAVARAHGVMGVVLVAAALWAAPASAQLRATPDPLPGSSFQGADGDQNDAPPLVDWQGLLAGGRVVHTPDPNDEDSAFAGGSEENEPENWDIIFEEGGVNPPKDNIVDTWSSVDQPAEDTFGYLAFARETSTGDAFLTFELNRDARLWHNGQSLIPCRRTGDISLAFEGVGEDLEVVIRRWRTTVADDLTDCARTGEFERFSTTDERFAQGAVNSGAILARLPGFYRTAVPAGRFAEGALNLSELLDVAFRDQCLAFASIWAHTRASDAVHAQLKDYVAPRPLSVRSCAASGVKFFDSNANGQRDAGEPGIPRFLIWADYDNDGVQDDVEPFSVTDDDGEYVIFDIRPPRGIYTLREKLLASRRRPRAVPEDWICSFPSDSTEGGTGSAPGGRFRCGWGPIDANATPNAEGRDFGNWFPARLTVKKVLEPASDPARFDLLVDGNVVLPAAGDGGSVTLSVPPGTYTVSERQVTGIDPALYQSTVECRMDANTLFRRERAVSDTIALAAGDEGGCTFRNVRIGFPAIAIRKAGPEVAKAGATLTYTLFVSNPGFVAFPESAVEVSDPDCDDPPRLVDKQGDTTPGTLDPGDTWIYRCERDTAPPAADCQTSRVTNEATVTATGGGATVDDDDAIATYLRCPDAPPPPIPVDPIDGDDAEEPGPVAPAGRRPPEAGVAAKARFLFRQATRGCLHTRIPRVDFTGTRIAEIRLLVNGRLRRDLNIRTLRAVERPRITLAPGRHRITARVTFQRGSGTPPVTLTRIVRICAPPGLPRFTG